MGEELPEMMHDTKPQCQEPQAGTIKRNPLSDILWWNWKIPRKGKILKAIREKRDCLQRNNI